VLIGHVPWAVEPTAAWSVTPPEADGPAAADASIDASAFTWAPQTPQRPRAPSRLPRRRHWLHRFFDAADLEAIDGHAELARDRVDRWVRQSPPLTMSVVLHVAVLLVLAVSFVRSTRREHATIELAFTAVETVEREDPGVTIVPEKVDEPAPEPEVAHTDKPPVEDVASAPVPIETEEPGPGAAADVPAAAAAIGTLLDGREEGRREGLVVEFGGSSATEAAVARALVWLVRQQGRDGLWSLRGPYADGGPQENTVAATAMALLALQGAGNTPEQGRHRRAVARAWQTLFARQLPTGGFELGPIPSQQLLYAHAQMTIALCELYGMTKNRLHGERARRALAFAVDAQGPAGGWRYEPRVGGDMSVTGWFVMALKSGQMAGLDVPPETLARVTSFLDSVAVDGGARYGYVRDPKDVAPRQITAAVSAEGLLCRQYLGWPRDEPRMVQGLDLLIRGNPIDFDSASLPVVFGAGPAVPVERRDKNVYAWYYITQVAHHFGGEPWNAWNARLKEAVPAAQATKGSEAGSWDPAVDQWGHIGGRLYMTCFCTFMLEVYYRHLPLYRPAAVGAAALPTGSGPLAMPIR
jgi:hypothetical protein